MATIVKNFDSYSLEYFSGKDPNGVDISGASIKCNDGHVLVGVLDFPYDYPLPWNSFSNNIIRMNFHISRINDVMNFLRYEKPLQLWFNDAKRGGWIKTLSHEPVGEQE